MKSISFIHCADLHLDSPFVGLKSLPLNIYKELQQSTFYSFTKIVDEAIKKEVDFLIIAGDLYDGEDRSIRAQVYFQREMNRLNEASIPVLVIHGNHDHLGGNWIKLSMPSNVHIFPSEVDMVPLTTKNGAKVHFYGFSYAKKHVDHSNISLYKKVEGADYHIGILHGHDGENPNHYSYAPFKMEDLIQKDFDYWALGHIHKRMILHEDPYIIYPGNIQGRHAKETGEKGCYYVEINNYQSNIEFINTAMINWSSIHFPHDFNIKSFDDLYHSLNLLKERTRKNGQKVILTIQIAETQIDPKLKDLMDGDDLCSLLQEGEENEENWVWVENISIQESEFTNQHFDEPFFEEIDTIFSELDDISEVIAPLFRNPKTRRYLEELTIEEQELLKKRAKKILYQTFRS